VLFGSRTKRGLRCAGGPGAESLSLPLLLPLPLEGGERGGGAASSHAISDQACHHGHCLLRLSAASVAAGREPRAGAGRARARAGQAGACSQRS
jgi:hypothetical protein